jgi:hypothetical protein
MPLTQRNGASRTNRRFDVGVPLEEAAGVCVKVTAASSQPGAGFFTLPEPAVARHPNVILAPRELRRWFDGLPFGNPPRTARDVLQQLRLLVRDPQPGNRLAALLDEYLAPLRRLHQVVDTRLPDDAESALPLDQLEYQVIELQSDLAVGYLRCANERLMQGKPPAATHLRRAAQLLDGAALLAALHYLRLPRDNWPRLLAILSIAEAHGLDRTDGQGSAGDDPATPTIRGLFFSGLVTALTDPNHQRPGRVQAWNRWLRAHCDGLELVLLPEGSASIPVDIRGERPPLAAARTARPGADTRYLALDPLLEALGTDEQAPDGLRQALLALVRGRRSPEQRGAPRQARDHPYRLASGLHAINQRLQALGGANVRGGVPMADARQINQSTSGAAFELPGPVKLALTVGEPLLAEAAGKGANGTPVGFLARLRRIVVDAQGQIEVGVEKLPGRILPVDIVGAANERLRGDNAALLIHQPDVERFHLVATRRAYREGELVSVEGPTVRYSLRMLGLAGGSRAVVFIDVEVARD